MGTSALVKVKGGRGRPFQPSQQPLSRGPQSHLQTTGQVEEMGVSEDPGPSSTLLPPGRLSLGKSLHLSGLQFPLPTMEKITSPSRGWRGPKEVTRIALHLVMATHLICCPEAQRNLRSFVASRKRSSRRHGALGCRRHMALRLEVAALLGASGLKCSGAPLCPRPHYPASWGPSTATVSLPWVWG